MSTQQGKTVLLTGATGFLGTHLVERLRSEKGVRLITNSRSAPSLDRPDVIHVASDLADLTSDSWRDRGIEAIDDVLHIGGFIPRVRGDANDATEAFHANIEGTIRLLASLPRPPERLVFASTVDVYSPAHGETITEESPTNPTGFYGASKLMCEHWIRSYAAANSCKWAILRYGHLYGPGEEISNRLIPATIRRLLRGENPVIYGDSAVLRNFLYVQDAVEATLRAASSDSPTTGPVNIVGDRSVSVRMLIDTLVRISDAVVQVRTEPSSTPVHSLSFDNRLMNTLLGRWEHLPLEAGLRREIEHTRALDLRL